MTSHYSGHLLSGIPTGWLVGFASVPNYTRAVLMAD